VSAGEGIRFAEIMNEFGAKIKNLGPFGSSEGREIPELQAGLEAASQLVPYFKLVERERFRVHPRTEDGYHKFFSAPDFEPLFKELVIDKLSMGRIMGALRAGQTAPDEIAHQLRLDPAEVARHLHQLSQQGMVRTDGGQVQLAFAA
jgi:hypothetical protein